MDIKNLQDAMKMQQELTAKLNDRIEILRKEKAPSLEVLLKEKEKSIARLRKDADNASKERELAVKRWDQRIEQRQTTLTILEKELAELKKQVIGRDDRPPRDTVKKTGRKKK